MTNSKISARIYFNTVQKLEKSGELYPASFNSFSHLLFSKRGNGVRFLKKTYDKGTDYIENILPRGSSRGGGEIDYLLTVSCFEHLMSLRSNAIFDMYRKLVRLSFNDAKAYMLDDNMVEILPPKYLREDAKVYVFTDSINSYKIGMSCDINKRLKDIQTGNPTIKLVIESPEMSRFNAFALERRLHKKYRKHRIRGEWFHLLDNQIKEIEKLFTMH